MRNGIDGLSRTSFNTLYWKKKAVKTLVLLCTIISGVDQK